MLNEQTLLNEYYQYLKDLYEKFQTAFNLTSNELIDIRLVILVMKGHSREYYDSQNPEIVEEFHNEGKKYTESIKSIGKKTRDLRNSLIELADKLYELENSKSYSEKQDLIINILKDIQSDFESIFSIIEKDILRTQTNLKEKVFKYGIDTEVGYSYPQLETLYEKVLRNISQAIELAKKGNASIKRLKTKIEELNQDKSFDKKEEKETEKVEKDTGKPIDDSFKPSKVDKRILLRITKDKTKAYIKLNIPRNDKQGRITKESILKAIEEKDISYGIIEENINYLVETQPRRNVLIAKGYLPTPGTDAFIEYKVDIFHRGEDIAEDEEGNIDFKEIKAYKPVKPGAVLAEKIPATKGENGMTVQGKAIEANAGLDKEFKLGKNVKLSEDGLKVIARIEGLPQLNQRNEIMITNLLIIPMDVDYSTGNIDFNGDVAIGGDVLSEFEVKAGGDILIKGNVYQSRIESVNGNIILDKGVSGDGNALIKCKGNLRAKFIEGAKVYCSGDIEVFTDIMHSEIYANGNIICRRGKGMISGGYVGVGKILECNILGSKSYTPTKVDLGVDMELRREQYDIVMELTAIKNYMEKARHLLEKIKKKYNRKKISKINYRRFINIRRAHNEKVVEFSEKKKEFDEYEKRKYVIIERSQLIVRKITYTKVEIKAGKRSFPVKTDYEMPLLFRYNAEEAEVKKRRIMPEEGFFEEEISYDESVKEELEKLDE